MAKVNKKLQERLGNLVKDRRDSEAAIARAIGIDTRTFNNYRHGRVPKDDRELQKIADHFEVNVPYLLGYTDDPSPSSPLSTRAVHGSLTPVPKNGAVGNDEELSMDLVLQSLVRLGNEMAALRQDVQDLNKKVNVIEAARRPLKGRKTQL